MADEYNRPATDWRAEVDRYAAISEATADHVRVAVEQTAGSGLPDGDRWEAVYTLAHQRAEMYGAQG